MVSHFQTSLAQPLNQGDNTVNEVFVSSLTTSDNHILAMAGDFPFGEGYIVIDPTSDNFEIVPFTGLDLSGVGFTGMVGNRGLPTYISGGETSVLANIKAHSAGVDVIITDNINWFIDHFVDKHTNQTIAGIKTFSSSPVVPTGGTGTQAANNADIANAITGASGTASTTVFGTVKITTANQTVVSTDDTRVPPTGSILMYGGSSAPTGWVLCDGTSYARVGTYAALFAAIGTNFGSADGSHFYVPDLRGRTAIGVGTGTGGGASGSASAPTGGSSLTARALGDWLGEETHALSSGELAAHTHTITNQGSHSHTMRGSGSSSNTNDVLIQPANLSPNQNGVSTTSAATISGTTDSTGSGTGHNTMQPTLAINHIIKI